MNATDVLFIVQTVGSVLCQGLNDAHGATQSLMAMRSETGPITVQEILAFGGSISPFTMACMILWQRVPSNFSEAKTQDAVACGDYDPGAGRLVY